MAERPILFSAPMVQAILAGRKTMTRRIIKPQPRQWEAQVIDITEPCYVEEEGGWGQTRTHWSSPSYSMPMGEPEREEWVPLRCPYGKPGDLLWVREAWAYVGTTDPGWLVYRADYPDCAMKYGFDQVPDAIEEAGHRWKPSIHMRRKDSRITLRVTEVRVERLHAISEADAEAEGAGPVLVPPDGGSCPHIEGFCALWNSINGADAWDANPWVWVVRFERVDTKEQTTKEIG